MRKYVKPVFEVAQVAANERIASGTSCWREGSCFDEGDKTCDPGWTTWTYFASTGI